MFRLTPGLITGFVFCFLLCLPTICNGQTNNEARVWSDNTGNFSIHAEFIEIKDGKVRLRRTDNDKVVAVPIHRLSDKDRQFLDDMNKPEAEEQSDDPQSDDPQPISPPNDPQPQPIVPDPAPGKEGKPDPQTDVPDSQVDATTVPEIGSETEFQPTLPANEPDMSSAAPSPESEAASDAPKLDAPKLDAAKLDAAKLDAAKLDAAKLDAAKLDAAKLDAAKLDAAKLDTAKLDTAKLDTAKLDTAKLDTAKLDTAKLDTAKLDDPADDRTLADESTATNDSPAIDGIPAIADPVDEGTPAQELPTGDMKPVPPDVVPFTRAPASEPKTFEVPRAEFDDSAAMGNATAEISQFTATDEEGTSQSETPSKEIVEQVSAPVGRGRYLETDPLAIIDDSFVSVETEGNNQPWITMSDEQLIEMVQLSSSVAWQGKVGVSHLLEPRRPNFNIVIEASGADFLNSAFSVGHVEFDTVVDEKNEHHLPFVLPPGIPNSQKGWVPPKREAGRDDADPGSASVFVNVEFPRPKPIPMRIESAKGQFKMAFGLRYQILTIKDVPANIGKVVHPAVQDKGLEIIVRRPDDITLVVEVSGDHRAVTDVKLTGVDEQEPGESRMNSSRGSFYQFNFVSSMPVDVSMEIRMVDEYRELTLPFEFEAMPFSRDR